MFLIFWVSSLAQASPAGKKPVEVRNLLGIFPPIRVRLHERPREDLLPRIAEVPCGLPFDLFENLALAAIRYVFLRIRAPRHDASMRKAGRLFVFFKPQSQRIRPSWYSLEWPFRE